MRRNSQTIALETWDSHMGLLSRLEIHRRGPRHLMSAKLSFGASAPGQAQQAPSPHTGAGMLILVELRSCCGSGALNGPRHVPKRGDALTRRALAQLVVALQVIEHGLRKRSRWGLRPSCPCSLEQFHSVSRSLVAWSKWHTDAVQP
jgi:hypothetical protein